VADFKRDGFVVMRSLFPRESMEDWKQQVLEDKEARINKLDPSTGRDVDADVTGVAVWLADEIPPFFADKLAAAPLASTGIVGGTPSTPSTRLTLPLLFFSFLFFS